MPLAAYAPTLDDYRLHLQMIAAWLAPLEHWLTRFDDGPQRALPFMARMPLIERDLDDASMRVEERQAAQWDAAAPAPDAVDAAYRWGVCYVIEGSQLGGAVLYGRLRDALAQHEIECACEGAKDAFDRLLTLLPVASVEAGAEAGALSGR